MQRQRQAAAAESGRLRHAEEILKSRFDPWRSSRFVMHRERATTRQIHALGELGPEQALKIVAETTENGIRKRDCAKLGETGCVLGSAFDSAFGSVFAEIRKA